MPADPHHRRRNGVVATLAWAGGVLVLAWWGPTPGTPSAPPAGSQAVPVVSGTQR